LAAEDAEKSAEERGEELRGKNAFSLAAERE